MGTDKVLVLDVGNNLRIAIMVRFLTAVEARVRLVRVIVVLRSGLRVHSLQDLVHAANF